MNTQQEISEIRVLLLETEMRAWLLEIEMTKQDNIEINQIFFSINESLNVLNDILTKLKQLQNKLRKTI